MRQVPSVQSSRWNITLGRTHTPHTHRWTQEATPSTNGGWIKFNDNNQEDIVSRYCPTVRSKGIYIYYIQDTKFIPAAGESILTTILHASTNDEADDDVTNGRINHISCTTTYPTTCWDLGAGILNGFRELLQIPPSKSPPTETRRTVQLYT